MEGQWVAQLRLRDRLDGNIGPQVPLPAFKIRCSQAACMVACISHEKSKGRSKAMQGVPRSYAMTTRLLEFRGERRNQFLSNPPTAVGASSPNLEQAEPCRGHWWLLVYRQRMNPSRYDTAFNNPSHSTEMDSREIAD